MLMIVVTRDQQVHNRIVALDEFVSQDELASIRNYINRNFSGWMLHDIHADLKRRLKQHSAAYDALLKKLTLLYSKGLLDIEITPEIHMEGASNLVSLDLHLTREKLRDLFHTLEEKEAHAAIVGSFPRTARRRAGRSSGSRRRPPQHGGIVPDRNFDSAERRTLRQDRRAGTHAHELRKGDLRRVSHGAGIPESAGIKRRDDRCAVRTL